EDIAGNNLNVWPVVRMRANFFLKVLGQARVRFNGYHSPSTCGEHLRHFSMTRADFDPGFAGTGSKNLQNAQAPSAVTKKVLPHALSSHADAECSNAARGEAKKCRRNHAGRIGNRSRDLLDEA